MSQPSDTMKEAAVEWLRATNSSTYSVNGAAYAMASFAEVQCAAARRDALEEAAQIADQCEIDWRRVYKRAPLSHQLPTAASAIAMKIRDLVATLDNVQEPPAPAD